MANTENNDAKRLIPEMPPQRLPEEALLTKLKGDEAYRRNASLLRSLLYRPQRLFTSQAPSRLLPSKTLRELRYRLIAVATSLALLIGMVNFAPFDFLSLFGTASAANADPYGWLLKNRGTADDPYRISDEDELYRLSLLIQGLPTEASTMVIKIGSIDYTVGPKQVDSLAIVNALPAPTETPAPPSAPSAETPTETPETPSGTPDTSPTETPAESPSTPPSEPPEVTPSETPSESPSESPAPSTTEPTVEPEPSVLPAETPAEQEPTLAAPGGTVLPLSVTFASVGAASPNTLPLMETTPDAVPDADSSPSPSTGETVTPSPSPTGTETVSPSPPPSATETVSPSPSPSVTETPSPSPSATGTTSPTPSPTATETASPSPSQIPPADSASPAPSDSGNSLELFPGADTLALHTLHIPVGMKDRYFVLTNDISLIEYSANSISGASLNYWLPIGVLRSFNSDGTPNGTPFLGTFDGGGFSVTDFYYAPDPKTVSVSASSYTSSGYGLFGYVGTGGTVRNLTVRLTHSKDSSNIPWVLSTFSLIESSKLVTKEYPLGGVSYAVGGVSAALSGTIENCTVSGAELSYSFKNNIDSNTINTSLGGITGLASGGTLTRCTFLGSIKTAQNTSPSGMQIPSALQAVGGVAGRIIGATPTALTQCASGADIDIHNGTTLNKDGGVGGLYGYNAAPTTIAQCFTTGVVRAVHQAGGLAGYTGGKVTVTDSFSTAAIGKTTLVANTLANTSKQVYDDNEDMGGLFGLMGGSGSSLSSVYFAGSLLEPQFASVAGRLTSTPTFTNTVVDGTQAPHSFFKNKATPGGIGRDLSVISGSNWVISADTLPQLTWTQTYTGEEPSKVPTTINTLSQLAAKRWVTLDSSNAVSGADRVYSLYRLKDGVDGNAPATLGRLTLDTTRTYKSADDKTSLGGAYIPTSTADATVDGVSIPILRSAITAINQVDYDAANPLSGADTLGTGVSVARFTERVNLAPGGYLGSVYTIPSGEVDATNKYVSLTPRDPLKTFWGTLEGAADGSSVIKGLSFGKGASGLIDTACDATVQNFTLKDVKADNASLGSPAGYCGFAVGQSVRTGLTKVNMSGLTYNYTQTSADNAYESTAVSIGLVGALQTGSPTFTNCNVSGVDVKVVGGSGALRLRFGGILGINNGNSSYFVTNCTMSGSVLLDFSSSSTNAVADQLPHLGGIIGYDNNTSATLTDCYVNANLRACRVGGIAGRMKSPTLSQCTFTGTIDTSKNYTGPNPTASDTTAAKLSSSASGGLLGVSDHEYAANPTINDCAVFGTVSSLFDAGGFIGYSQVGITASNSYANAIVTTVNNGGGTGGLFGYILLNKSISFTSCYFTGQVSSPGTFGALGGQAPASSSISLNTTYYDNTLTQRGISPVGGKSGLSDCGLRPDDTKWGTDYTGVWTQSPRHYPQLARMTRNYPALSSASTYQLFDAPDTLSSLYDFAVNDTFSTTLPAEIAGTSISTPSSFEQSGVSGNATSYKITATAFQGKLQFSYSAVPVNGTPLALPYTIAIRPFDYGNGTKEKPFIIYNLDQLQLFAAYINSDMDAQGTYYQVSTAPVGDDFSKCISTEIKMWNTVPGDLDWKGTTAALKGQLDGFGSTLKGLTSTGWEDTTGKWNAGLLGGLSAGSTVENLTITDVAITSPELKTGTGHAVGILSATAGGGKVADVQVQGTITADRDVYAGGLIGTSNGAITVERCFSNVDILGQYGNGSDTAAAGGLIGFMSGANVTATIDECAAYGSIQDWGGVGGLVGRVNNGSFGLKITNSYSLTNFSDTGDSSTVLCGGIIGSVVNLSSTTSTTTAPSTWSTTVNSCYYAGENKMNTTRVLGGIVGGAQAAGTPTSKDNYGNLMIQYSPYNYDLNHFMPAKLYYSGSYQGNDWGWPTKPTSSYGTVSVSTNNSYQMSQSEDKRKGYMANWNKNSDATKNPWSFDDGMFPSLSKTESIPSDALTLRHVAVIYTAAGSRVDNRYTNVYVLNPSAKLDIGDSEANTSLLLTFNERMAVATDNRHKEDSIPVYVVYGTARRVIYIFPSVDATGYRDTSIYYVNQEDGMWQEDGKKVWKIYNADALAGLSTLFSTDSLDQNQIPSPGYAFLENSGCELQLARDIDDLDSAYHGMSQYLTWRAIGNESTPFTATLDGKGHTVYDLAMNPFYEKYDNGSRTYNYYNLDSTEASQMSKLFGLFGVIGSTTQQGTVKNLVLASTASPVKFALYQQPGIRVAPGVTAAGALAAKVANGTLENCLVSTPVYSLYSAPNIHDSDIWHLTSLGIGKSVPMGGLVGQVTGKADIVNCSYTGYVYAAPLAATNTGKNQADKVADPANAGTVGGLVGHVNTGATLNVTNSFAAGFVLGGTEGGMVGQVDTAATLNLSGASYDQNAAGGSVQAIGSGAAASGSAATEIPVEIGDGWENLTPEGLYPLQTALLSSANTLAARMRIDIVPHAGSATSGTLRYTTDSTLFYEAAAQPYLDLKPGTVTVDGATFTKGADGPVQLELWQGVSIQEDGTRKGGSTRRVLANLICWYDEGYETKHFTISSADELWELSEIVNGTFNTDATKVGHRSHNHALADGTYDDFSGCTIKLAADIDLSKLVDRTGDKTVTRSWEPIGGGAYPFAGTFNGNGHSISGLSFANAEQPTAIRAEVGLFGTVGTPDTPAVVCDLLITNANLSLSSTSAAVGGILATHVTKGSQLLYCGVSGTITANGANAVMGGLAGTSEGIIEGCFSTAELTLAANISGGYVGGITGRSTGGSITKSYFTGFANTVAATLVGGISGDNGAANISDCYVSAYLDGGKVYHIANNGTGLYDSRHTKSNPGGGGTAAGADLSMSGTGWEGNTGTYYPIPTYFVTNSVEMPDMASTALGRAAKLAAAIFTFSGSSGGSNYSRFKSVSVPAATADGCLLRSGNTALLLASGSTAQVVDGNSGEVALRLCLDENGKSVFQRPGWLYIPATLAVTYRFNWDELIFKNGSSGELNEGVKLNEAYHTGTTTKNSWDAARGIYTISTAADWNSFVSYINNSADGGSGKTFTLDYDVDFANTDIPTVTGVFKGAFNGGGHTLRNFTSSAPLFASIAQNAKVEVLGISNGNLTISATGTFNAALLAGQNDGRIANVAAEGCKVRVTQGSTSSAVSTYVGGLVGQNNGVLDSSYFYAVGAQGDYQVSAYYPAGTTPNNLRMGGLVGYNKGTVTGCYSAAELSCYIGGVGSGNYNYFSALVGLNDGSIRYTYWKMPYNLGSVSGMLLTSYRNGAGSDVSYVPGETLFMGDVPTEERTARWLSARSYGGSYYMSGGQLKLYAFRLIQYDLTEVFGSYAEQFLMLGLQFSSESGDTLFSNAVCSWKDYLLPNFASLPTSALTVRIPMLSSKLTYELSAAYAIHAAIKDLDPMTSVRLPESSAGGYTVTGLPDNTSVLFLDLKLSKVDSTKQPWGVYRKDSTLPQEAAP